MEKILVVEDDDDIVEILVETLSGQNFECLMANDGIKALELCDEHKFDCILSDINMPNLSGLAFFEKLNTKEFVPPLVFLTSHANKEILRQALLLGALDYIEKPFEVNVLIDVVTRATQIGRRQRLIYDNQSDKNKSLEKEIRTLKAINHRLNKNS